MTALLSIGGGWYVHPEKDIDETLYLREIAPDVTFSPKQGIPLHYSSDRGIIAFNTYDVTPSIRGYAGPIKLLIALRNDGTITGIRILDHRETKNYVHYMESSGYLSGLLGKNVSDPFEVDGDIDGISRATVSVEALAKTVRESSRIAADQAFGIKTTLAGTERRQSLGWVWYSLLFSFVLLSYSMSRRAKRFLRARDISLVGAIAIIGLSLSSPFSILHVFNLMLLRPSSSLLWYVIVVSTIASVIIAGRLYCGWLCPFGAISEFIGRLPLKKWNISVEQDDRWRGCKYVLLAAVLALVFLSGKIDYGNFETYVTLFSFHGTAIAWVLVAVMLLANLVVERFWCRYLCPVAAFTGVLSRKAQGYPSRNDCPMGNKPNPLISECVRCNRCYAGEKNGK